MPLIHILDEPTINQIAAGEVVERPSAVVKELIENAMDAGATAITAEIKEGGLSFIRITDNGAGIAREDIPLAFLRHATSKIRSAEDLLSVTSLGFRGEALSSISAVAQLELITKTPSALNGYRYMIEGGEEKSIEEIGCPGGTTIIVRNLFYNTPARRKFLKSAVTEAGYISDLMERLMISHPGISFKFMMNNQVKLQSTGNHSSRDILYNVYGRDITRELLALEYQSTAFKLEGFIGKPIITRGNRNYENYFINGRYIRSNLITKAIEEAYKPFLMQHKYPFTSLYFEMDPSLIDVNVHPQKLEIRLKNGEEIYQQTLSAIRSVLAGKELIPKVSLTPLTEQKKESVPIPEPFEGIRRRQSGYQNSFPIQYEDSGKAISIPKVAEENKGYRISDHKSDLNNQVTERAVAEDTSLKGIQNTEITKETISEKQKQEAFLGLFTDGKESPAAIDKVEENQYTEATICTITGTTTGTIGEDQESEASKSTNGEKQEYEALTDISTENEKQSLAKTNLPSPQIIVEEQIKLFESTASQSEAPFLSSKALAEHRIIGQVFSTYWLVEYKKELYIIDQHAAHEKVLYERIISSAKSKNYVSQQLLPPIVLSLTLKEQELVKKHTEVLASLGYEIEPFGGNEYSVRAVPADLYNISEKELLMEFIDALSEDFTGNIRDTNSILERVASLSCKAAVKANHTFSNEEAATLIKELLTLENPYHCPHGRPVIISMSQYELERKFKRII